MSWPEGIGPPEVAVFAAFWGLLAWTLATVEGRYRLFAKPAEEWVLDLSGLAVQGIGVPVLQATFAAALVLSLDPELVHQVELPPWAAFGLAFVVVDYLFYWNHRLLHGPLWPAHQVHHTMVDRDVLGTSRNTLWTSALICYLWVHSVALVVLADPTWYLAGVAATSALDLWRHSTLDPPWEMARVLDPWLILPKDHAMHHAEHGMGGNFGANLKIWDRLHGTYIPSEEATDILGYPSGLSLGRKLLWPFPPASEEAAS